MTDDDQIQSMSFEEALQELENIVGQLESGDTPLEKSIRIYERGSRLKKRCQEALRAAEERIEKISLDEQNRPTGTEPFSANE